MATGTKRKHIEIKIEVKPTPNKRPRKSPAQIRRETNVAVRQKWLEHKHPKLAKQLKKAQRRKAEPKPAEPKPAEPKSTVPRRTNRGKKEPKVGQGPPFIVYFPSNDVKHDDMYAMEAYRPKDPNKKQPQYLIHKQIGANLIGSTAAPPQTAHNKAKYCVGIYSKAQRTLTLTAVGGDTVVKIEPQAAFADDAEVAGLNIQTGKPAQARPQDLAARRGDARKLVEAFGSTRRRRQLKQRDEAQVIVEQNADEERLHMIMGEVAAKAAATGETREEVMARVGAARVVPVHNPKATKPEDAYKISAMFPQQLMAALNIGQLLHAAEKTEDLQKVKEHSKVPDYIISRLSLLQNYPESRAAERKKKARHLALLAALIQLATAKPRLRTFPAKPAVDDKPGRPGGLEELARMLRIGRTDVLEPLLDQFYEKGNDGGQAVYTRDNYHQQLLQMHVLVVALEVEGWSMAPQQFDSLRESLKMTTGDLVSRFRELGCSCSSSKLQTATGASVGSYTVRLLPDGKKSLEQCFPAQKAAPKQRGK